MGGVDGIIAGLAYRQCPELMHHHFRLHQVAKMPRHGYRSFAKWLQVIDEVERDMSSFSASILATYGQ